MKVDSDTHKINLKVYELTKYGLSAEKIYEINDVGSRELLKEGMMDLDVWDFHYSDMTRDLELLEKYLVASEHKNCDSIMHSLSMTNAPNCCQRKSQHLQVAELSRLMRS